MILKEFYIFLKRRASKYQS